MAFLVFAFRILLFNFFLSASGLVDGMGKRSRFTVFKDDVYKILFCRSLTFYKCLISFLPMTLIDPNPLDQADDCGFVCSCQWSMKQDRPPREDDSACAPTAACARGCGDARSGDAMAWPSGRPFWAWRWSWVERVVYTHTTTHHTHYLAPGPPTA